MNDLEPRRYKYGISPFTIGVIGFLYTGALIFSYFESNFLNTYLDHVLELSPLHIAVMVSLSAFIGLTFLPLWGIISDNTRTKYGRRRPFLPLGIIAGAAMIIYAFSEAYVWCVILDAVIIGIFSNALYAGQRTLVPDLVDIEYRGRVNGIVNILGSLGIVIGIAMTLIANEYFTTPRGTGNIITQEGHIFLLSFAGGIFIIAAIVGFLCIREKPEEFPPKKPLLIALKEMFNPSELKKHREFFKLILAITVYKSGLGIIMPYLFNFIFSLGLETIELVLVLGTAAPLLFISIFILGKLTDSYGRKKFLIPITLLSSLGFITLPFLAESRAINLYLLIPVITLILVGALGILIPLDTWSQDLLPDDKRAQFFGILNIVNTLSQIVGAILGGIIATALIGKVLNPLGWLFAFVPIFLISALPLFIRVKETLPENFQKDLKVL